MRAFLRVCSNPSMSPMVQRITEIEKAKEKIMANVKRKLPRPYNKTRSKEKVTKEERVEVDFIRRKRLPFSKEEIK